MGHHTIPIRNPGGLGPCQACGLRSAIILWSELRRTPPVTEYCLRLHFNNNDDRYTSCRCGGGTLILLYDKYNRKEREGGGKRKKTGPDRITIFTIALSVPSFCVSDIINIILLCVTPIGPLPAGTSGVPERKNDK